MRGFAVPIDVVGGAVLEPPRQNDDMHGRDLVDALDRLTGVSSEWGYDDTGGTVGRSIADRGNGDAMGVAVDCDGG